VKQHSNGDRMTYALTLWVDGHTDARSRRRSFNVRRVFVLNTPREEEEEEMEEEIQSQSRACPQYCSCLVKSQLPPLLVPRRVLLARLACSAITAVGVLLAQVSCGCVTSAVLVRGKRCRRRALKREEVGWMLASQSMGLDVSFTYLLLTSIELQGAHMLSIYPRTPV